MNTKAIKRLFMVAALFGAVTLTANAQQHDQFANFNRYAQQNRELGKPSLRKKRVVLMGNSITDGWPGHSPEFFKQHPYLVGRGISGQTSYQFLLRFRQDVINLMPKIVVINYGTNDIALNTGPYDEDKTMDNIMSMVDIARANKIKVILTSCLPAEGFSWRPEVKDAMSKIRHLNARVQEYAKKNKIPYVDYFSAMVSADGTCMNPDYAQDSPGVHPNAEGYKVMESLLLPVIEAMR